MSATSPTPNSPPSSSPPSPSSSSSPPPPSPQPNENPPESSNSTSNTPPPPLPPPSAQPTAPLPPLPPPQPVESPPPVASPPPPPSVPVTSPPPEESPPAPPPPLSSPPPANPAPPPLPPPSPPSTDPPLASPPPPLPLPSPPLSSPPPPLSRPPPESPPSPPDAPSPPPPTRRSSPPPRSPPRTVPPTSSLPPPPEPIAPENSPPPPPPRRRAPPTPSASNPTPPPENSPPEPSLSSPPPRLPTTPLSPLPSLPSPSPPPPVVPSSRVPISPASNETSNDSSPIAPGSANSNGGAGIGTGGVAAIAVVASILLLSLFGLAFWCARTRRKKISSLRGHIMPTPLGTSPNSDSTFLKVHSTVPLIGSRTTSDSLDDSPRDPAAAGLGNSRPFFGFEELVQATNGFSAQNLLGEGGFGSVYKGYLPDGREIAVKQLKIGGGQGEREFKAEVEIISRVHHRHLVSLVGYCISDTRRLLVYDYVPNNNLYHHLHGEGRPVLEWPVRVKIAAGSARGIAYLHEDCHPRIIHRDIKSSNILLNDNFDARVSDFGLAKLALDADTHITTRVMGTFGYVAPEYASSGKLTDKSDVYSFGVVMLELITGRKPVDASQPLGDESLVEWARPLLSHAIESGEYGNLVDPKLESNYVESEMLRMIEIAAACVRHSSAKRPRMSQVVRAFDSLGASDITNGMRVGESEVFNSAQQSEEIRWFQRMAFGSQYYSTDFYSQDKTREENRENNA